MAKGQKKTTREAKKEKSADKSASKTPRYLAGTELSTGSKVSIPPKKSGKG